MSGQFDIIGSRISSLIAEEISKEKNILQLIQQALKYFFLSEHDKSIESFTEEQNELLCKKFQVIVDEHAKIINLCNGMSKTLSENVFIHYTVASITTCICCLMIMLAEGAEKIVFVNYIMASTTTIFVYSIGGNFLIDASTRVSTAAYNFQWYKCNVKVRKMILMIIMRGQEKTGIIVPFFEASLETFGLVSSLFTCCILLTLF